MGRLSLFRLWMNGWASPVSPKSATRGDGANIPGSPMPYSLYVTASSAGLMASPPRAVSWAIETICGVATTAVTSAASARRPQPGAGRPAQQPGQQHHRVRMAASTADSESVSTAAPSPTPSSTAWRTPGERRSRTAVPA